MYIIFTKFAHNLKILRMRKLLLALIISTSFLTANAENTLLVGGDVSVLQSYEDHNVPYLNKDGDAISDMLTYLKSDIVGWNALRVRLFVNPRQKDGDWHTDAQVCQDLNYVVRFCKRVKAAGYSLLLDFHYSDTWADPANQWIPESWAGLTDEQLKEKIYTYTKECLQTLVDNDATPDFIQIGNEISYGMLWSVEHNRASRQNRCYSDSYPTYWTRFINLLGQASKACREICPDAQIVIHTERSGYPSALQDIYTRLSGVDYDIIGLSYYPFWHNSLSVLSNSLETLATNFPEKRVHIVETAYYYQYPSDIIYDFSNIWPYTPEGQSKFIKDLIDELKKHTNVDALYWWFPEENGNGPDGSVLTGWINRGFWNNSTHTALPGLYIMKDFLDRSTDVDEAHTDEDTSTPPAYFDLMGREVSQPTEGIYIMRQGGKTSKILK